MRPGFQKVDKLRLAEEARSLRDAAKILPPGAARDATLRLSRQGETGSRSDAWADSPGYSRPLEVLSGLAEIASLELWRPRHTPAIMGPMSPNRQTSARPAS